MTNCANVKLNPCEHKLCQECLKKMVDDNKSKCHSCRKKFDHKNIEIISALTNLDDFDNKIVVSDDRIIKLLPKTSILRKVKSLF